MSKKKKRRLNLYLSEDTIKFAKEWSYVTEKPISQMLEEYLINQKKLVINITPFQWLSDPVINQSTSPQEKYFEELEEYINDREEEEFCQKNPDHPRAKIRRNLINEYQKLANEEMELKKEKEKELIKRWMEVFQPE